MPRPPKEVSKPFKPEPINLTDAPGLIRHYPKRDAPPGYFDPPPVAKRPTARQFSDTVIIIDDKGVFAVRPDGTAITEGYPIVFQQFEFDDEDGTTTRWESANTGSVGTEFDSLKDIQAYCHDHQIGLQYVLLGAKWVVALKIKR